MRPITVEYAVYAQSLTNKPVKGMLTGPVTILNWSFPREDVSLEEQALQIALMDLSLTKQLGRMMVFAGIDNLFDKTFDTDSSFAIPGRVWKVGAEWKF